MMSCHNGIDMIDDSLITNFISHCSKHELEKDIV